MIYALINLDSPHHHTLISLQIIKWILRHIHWVLCWICCWFVFIQFVITLDNIADHMQTYMNGQSVFVRWSTNTTHKRDREGRMQTLTIHEIVIWVELTATRLVIVGAIGPMVLEGLNQWHINYRDLLSERVVAVVLVGLLVKPTTLDSVTWMV